MSSSGIIPEGDLLPRILKPHSLLDKLLQPVIDDLPVSPQNRTTIFSEKFRTR